MSLENTTDTSNEEISIKDLFLKIKSLYNFLLSKWKIIVCFGMLGGGIGLVLGWVNKPVYIATTTFVLEDPKSGGGGLGQLSGLAAIAGLDLGGVGGGGLFQGETLLELYKTRLMLKKTLLSEIEYEGKKELLIDRYITINKLRQTWDKKPKLKNIQFRDSVFSRTQDSVLNNIVDDIKKNYLSVNKADKKTNILSAQVKSGDEFFSKTFNEKIVANVNDFYIKTKNKKALDNVRILQNKVDSVRAIMNGAITKVASVTDGTPNLNTTRMAQRLIPAQRSQFTIEVSKAMLGQLIQNLELSKVNLEKESPLIQVIDGPVYPLEKKKMGRISGTILGGVIAGFLTCVVLVLRKMISLILA